MREYAKVMPKFWHGETCQDIRAGGSEGALVALYLMTSPMSNMLGLYSQPILYMAEETGLGLEGARKGLQACIDAGFCRYHEPSKTVWVMEMAAYQIASNLKASDNRCAGIQKDYDGLPNNPFLGEFFDRYQRAFHLTNRRDWKGASKPLPSQEQEQEQEQEQDSSSSLRSDSSAPLALTAPNGEPADLKAKRAQRIQQIAEDARAAYNRILAKPHGELSACTVLNKPRLKAVEKALATARLICLQQYGSEKITAQFWEDYFTEASLDDFHSGRKAGGPGHENWRPDFEFLLRESVMAKLFDRAASEDAA